jgi:predicted AAA+ superfamily ATPase
MIERIQTKSIIDRLKNSTKAIILLGPRQVGKTTLLKNLIMEKKNSKWLNADNQDVQSLFEQANSTFFKKEFKGAKYLIIDEAQRIKNIGLKLKLITDDLPGIQLIVTGSSSFELANEINEPLTGRKWEYRLFPLSYEEMVNHHGLLEERRLLNHRLVYGYYPEVVTAEGEEKEVLKQLTDSYLYKDILIWNKINKSEKLVKLLQALAFQIGSQVSYNELGKMVGLDNETIDSYLQLLEQTFVIFRLGSFNRNLRTELKKSRKIYFYDNGIRNALIADFRMAELRQDKGALWENFLMAERMKVNAYHNRWVNRYFWRTKQQQEIDYLEESDGQLNAFEFKWQSSKEPKVTKTFVNAYAEAKVNFITKENFETFILP